MTRRALTFAAVGVGGFIVQTGLLSVLTRWHWSLALATLVAVEAAIVVNYLGHRRWTWSDRGLGDLDQVRRFARFQFGNGLTSLVGNVVLTGLFANGLDLHPVAANILAVAVLSVVNFATADRWVFATKRVALVALLLPITSSVAGAAEPSKETLDAWNQHVASIERSVDSQPMHRPRGEPEGHRVGVPGGTIHEWRGTVVVRNTTVERVVDRLLDPCALPPQEDVAAVRLLERRGDRLKVYMRLVRKMIVTATYDTEHAVSYTRHSAGYASSRSIATKIVEVGGEDRGFLWRLNAYWQYRQVGNDVQIDLLSISLSRDVPWVLKPIAPPLIERVGRESMTRTLRSVLVATDHSERSQAASPALDRTRLQSSASQSCSADATE